MKLSPLLIKKQEFEKSFRGYNVDEVHTFLDKISSEMEDLINENEALEQEVENLNPYEVIKDEYNELNFKEVNTSSIKMEVKISKTYSSGILEWIVE